MWLLPTYNRPEGCKRTLQSLIDTGCTTPGVVVVNGNLDGYEDLPLPTSWMVHVTDSNLGSCGAMRWAFNQYPHEDFYGYISDDETAHTEGWDQLLIEAAGEFYVAHGNNGVTSKDNTIGFCTIGGDLVRKVGWWAPENLWHWYFNAYWEVIAKRCDIRKFCKDVEIVERHYKLNTAEFDETYRLGEEKNEADQLLFLEWLRDTNNGMLPTCARITEYVHRNS